MILFVKASTFCLRYPLFKYFYSCILNKQNLISNFSWLPISIFCILAESVELFESSGEKIFWFIFLISSSHAESMMLCFSICHLIGVTSCCTNPVLYGFLNPNLCGVVEKFYQEQSRRISSSAQTPLSVSCRSPRPRPRLGRGTTAGSHNVSSTKDIQGIEVAETAV